MYSPVLEERDKPLAGKKEDRPYLGLTFSDITDLQKLAIKYRTEKICTMIVDIDNYDELLASTEDGNRALLISHLDNTLRKWGSTMHASITKYAETRYLFLVEKKYLDQQERVGFDILAEFRHIPTEADFPITLSIGISYDGHNPAEDEKNAKLARDKAKGRGGDQVVLKWHNSLRYYGRLSGTVEKRNKGKSRVIGYALRGLFDSASNILIMGHKNPDMDAFGSALGICCAARQWGKRAYIVIDKTTEALELLYHKVLEEDEHEIISSQRALELLDEKTVVVMVDTHRVTLSECPELFERAVRTVIIDHHRKSEEYKKMPTLAYTESYASSTAELVTEILEYTVEKKDILPMEANALLAGIMLDTNGFSVKSGVRTFEAAAWLKRNGADNVEVKKFFQISPEIFRLKTDCYNSVEIDQQGMAFAVYNGRSENAQVINSQVADELLTIRGVRASFVTSQDEEGRTYISARSLGDVNVQVLMEYFGGGGHLNTAGAQVSIPPEEAIETIKERLAQEEHH